MPTDEALEDGAPELSNADWHKRWKTELDAAKEQLKPWHEQVEKIEARYLDERTGAKLEKERRRPLFTANVQTQEAVLYGQTPSVSVSRRFSDSSDDVARVAGELLERLLNTDIERDGDNYAAALGLNVTDLLLAAFGSVRFRYACEMRAVPEVPAKCGPDGAELAPAIPSHECKAWEDAESEYVHWRDQLWSPCRVWHEVRWLAFRAELSRKQLKKMFGEEIGAAIPLNVKANKTGEKKADSPWDRAEVWEIWSKDDRRVYHYVEDYPSILFPVANPTGEDPLRLEGFWPCPRPMFRNLTNSKLVPRPDFVLAQDLYNEVDDLSTRITLLQDAVRVTGVYDKNAGAEVARLVSGSAENLLIPCDRWAMLAEKGGIKGVVDWFPLEQVVGALQTLRDYRREVVEEVREMTGMADIMRGQGGAGNVSATEQGIKAKFGSVRLQRAQDEIARYATEGQRLRAEIICKHFDAETIIQRSNAMLTADKDIAPAAVELLKSNLAQYRIEVKPEAVSLTDFAALKQERTEVIDAVARFLTAAQPMIQQAPTSGPYLLEMLKWMVSGLRGSSEIEGVLDRAIEAAQRAAQQPQQAAPPDPKLMAKQAEIRLKGEMDRQKIAAETQADLVRTGADVQAEDAKQESQAKWNLREKQAGGMVRASFSPGLPGGVR